MIEESTLQRNWIPPMAESKGLWSQVEIAGKAADVYEPHNTSCPDRVILHLHGHGLETLKENPHFSAELDRLGFRVVCPHGQRSWWLDTICEEFDPTVTPLAFVRKQIVSFIRERWNVSVPQIGLTGISMGGQGVLQLAYRFGREFPVVAAISPAVDFHNWYGRGLPLDQMFPNQEEARQQTATLHLMPLDWPRHQLIVCDPNDVEWIESSERLTSKLYSSGIPFESDLETSNGGHSWDYFNSMASRAISFVAERLDEDRKRLPIA